MNTLSKDIDKIVFRCFDQGTYWGKLAYSNNERPDQPDEPIDRSEATKAINKLISEFIKDLPSPKLYDDDSRASGYARGHNDCRKKLLELAENSLADKRGSDDS